MENGNGELKAELKRNRTLLFSVGAVLLLALIIGAVFFHYTEGFSWLNAFYFCTITLATVGYGDLVPKTDLGKLFTMFYVLLGIGILATFANLLLKNAGVRNEMRRQRRSQKRLH